MQQAEHGVGLKAAGWPLRLFPQMRPEGYGSQSSADVQGASQSSCGIRIQNQVLFPEPLEYFHDWASVWPCPSMRGSLCFACITDTQKTIAHLDDKFMEGRDHISSVWIPGN